MAKLAEVTLPEPHKKERAKRGVYTSVEATENAAKIPAADASSREADVTCEQSSHFKEVEAPTDNKKGNADSAARHGERKAMERNDSLKEHAGNAN